MSDEPKYLRPNVVIEPLVDNWYAWPHLISPATAAMNITGRHLEIMQSYVSAPQIHAQAVKNPKMRGGPFMDLPVHRVGEVKALQERTRQDRKMSLCLSAAIKQLDNLLRSEATGSGLEGLYAKVPSPLQGYVELLYDRHNNPGFRFFESLLYNSEFYNKGAQSIALWITDNDQRPFVLSTPRLDDGSVLRLPLSFDHPGIDALAEMKRKARPTGPVRELLGIGAEQEASFDRLFTTEAPPPYRRYEGDRIRMRYFGHACILVETRDISILVDPLISYYGYHSDVAHFSDADLPETIDYVLITHNHQDHILLETLLPLRHRIRNIVVPRTSSGKLEDPDLKLMFQHIGFSSVIAMGEMENLHKDIVSITALPFTGEHSDLDIRTKSCYLVQIGQFKLCFLADSRILESALYRHIHAVTGDIDVLFLGMECDGAPLSWLYGPLITQRLSREQDNSRRLSGSDCARGMSVIDIFHPKEVYVYAMGQEPWLEFISSIKYTDASNPIIQSNMLIDQCRKKGLLAERLYGEKELLYEYEPTMA